MKKTLFFVFSFFAVISFCTSIQAVTNSSTYNYDALNRIKSINNVAANDVPSAPTIGPATAGNVQATVSFSVPVNNGGSAIKSYTVTSTPGGQTATGTSPIILSGLTNGTAYTFTVVATNAEGNSVASAASNSVTPCTVPNAPTIDTATAGNSLATVSFTAPTNNGGSPITGYTVTTTPGGQTATGTSSPIIVSGLTGGNAYTFSVVATNAAGSSVASAASNSVTPYTFPNAPTIGPATAGNSQATVGFSAPANNGGSAITIYTVTSTPGSQTATGTTSPIIVSGLTNGTAYTFTVVATNVAGNSVASAASNSVTPCTVPSAPTMGTATAGNGQATVSFSAPVNNGGNVITDYTVTSTPGGQTATGSSSPIVVNGLTNGTAYTFAVVATNAIGSSVASAASNSVAPSSTIPGAPAIGTATAGNSQATVAFTAPANNGGSAITSYTVTSTPGGRTATGTSSPIIVNDLTNGTAYTFTVVATNVAGNSVASAASNSVTPCTVPNAPTIGTATTGNSLATVSFTAPTNNGGSPITGYTVTSTSGGQTATGTSSPIVVNGLTNGTAYTFTVVATNVAGSGVASAASNSMTPCTVPDAPTIGTATAGNGQATVTYTAPDSNGGSPIFGYTVTANPGAFTASGTGSPLTVSGLTNGASYTFTVTATNTVGTGASSAVSNSVIPTRPLIPMVTTLAGTAGQFGSADGTGAAARFRSPTGVAVDGSGNLYVADYTYSIIRKITATGVVTTLAGTAGLSGSANGTGAAARFYAPFGVAVDGIGNLYVTDRGNHTLRKITSAGVVTTLAGTVGLTGSADGTGAAARFNSPSGVVVDGSGNLYVTEINNHTIRKITAGGVVTTLAGTAGQAGSTDGTGVDARFYRPSGVTVDGSGNLYVADCNNHTIRKITAAGLVTTLAGTAGLSGSADGTSGAALFYQPSGVTVDGSGNLYVADSGNHTIRKVTAGGVVTTLAGTAGLSGSVDGTGGVAQFYYPIGVTADGSDSLYIVDYNNHTIRKIILPLTVPDAPTIGTATASNSQATVSFTAPANNGGSAITSYTVTSTPDGQTATGTSSPIIVNGLTNGTTYTFTVVATNVVGSSVTSAASNTVTPYTVPDAPTISTATAGNSQATVSFSAPANNGGSAITSYTVTSTPGGQMTTGTSSPIIVNDLTNGIAYTFTVIATNAVGSSVTSAASNSVTPISTVPDAPTIGTATAGDGQAIVDFTAPANNGGSPITSYTVTSTTGGQTTTGTSSPIIVSGLTNGTSYTFTVVATNAGGSSVTSMASNSVTPCTVPDAPTIGAVTAGNGQATVSFTTPGNNGGSDITSYTVTSTPGGQTVTGPSSPIIVSGLTNGTAYTFTVVATNAVGNSVASTASNSVVPSSTVPDAPTIATATAGDGQVTVSFIAPANNGGSAITSYTITSTPDGRTATGTSSPIIVSGLTNGTAYTFTVVATNAVGSGVASMASNNVTPCTVPDTPTIGTATVGNNQATVSFTAPANNGGSAIMSYTIISTPGGRTATGTTSPIIVSGLTNGTTYTFTVVATNAVGSSVTSAASNSVTPCTVPDAPTIGTATAGDGQATVSFTAPANNGGIAITGYTIISTPGGQTATGTSSPIIVSGLTNGTNYTFTVVATNAIGSSVASSASNSVTPCTVPDAPNIDTATAGNGQAIVDFTAPANNGGSAITSYTVTSTPGGQTATGTSSPIIVSGLTNGTDYTFTVVATNAVGNSVASTASNSVTPSSTVPDAPTIGVATAGEGQATVSFSAPANNGGSPIFGYTVTANPDGFTASGTDSPLTISGLTNGASYTFTVTATNAIGTGASSSASNSVVPTRSFMVTTLAGTAGLSGSTNGTGVAARFYSPFGVAVDGSGNLYVSDRGNHTIRKITADGMVTNLAGYPGLAGSTDGPAPSARFSSPAGVAMDGSGNLYVASSSTIRKITAALTVSTLAGTAGQSGSADGTGAAAQFNGPLGVAVTGSGNIYVADTYNHTIRKITAAAVVTTPAGFTGQAGSANGTGAGARFNAPYGVAVAGNGNIYVADYNNHTIRKITPTGVVTTLAGTAGQSGSADGTGAVVRFTCPSGVAVDGSGNIYVADKGNNTIRKVTASGVVTTLVGTAGQAGSTDGAGAAARFTSPTGVAVDGSGNIYVTDTGNHTIRKIILLPYTVPDAPTIGTATAGNSQATVAFTAPDNNGGNTITSYTVTSTPGGQTATGSSSPIIVNGLTNDIAYTFTVVATNVLGSSVASATSNSVTPSNTVPDVPTVGTATAGNGQATVSFTAPANNGGSSITGYTVTSTPDGQTTTGSSSPIILSGLTNGTAYTFTVIATNAVGNSVASTASNSVTPCTVPDAPTVGTATAGDGQATVSFTAPANNGGSAITGYTVISTPDGQTTTGSSSPIIVSGLTNGTAYTFTVVATNAVGNSVASAASNSVTPSSTVPDAPSIGTATAANGQATVSFTAPANNGGSAITSYTVTSTPDGQTATGTSSPIIVSGLTNGTAYTFTVVATNAVGSSVASAASNSVTPSTVPDAPTVGTATAGNGQATVSFNPPANNGGTPIFGYTVIASPGGFSASGTDSPLTVSGLTNGTSYTFTVAATNAVGTGASSSASSSVIPTGSLMVTTLAGSIGLSGNANGTGAAARFNLPYKVAANGSGDLYVSDYNNHTIRKITTAGVVTTLAGSAGLSGSANGTGTAARFFRPRGVAVDGSGNIYVADSGNCTIRKITATGVVSTLAGTAGQLGSANGTGAAARFSLPDGVTVGVSGNLYVADTGNNTIRKITATGVVTTLAGSAGLSGSANGTGTAARFYAPRDVTVDGSGNLYAADYGNNTIRKITATGVVTTLAGTAGQTGSADGSGAAARFNGPYGVAVDGSGNIYVADSTNYTIRKITAAGVVTTLAGTPGQAGSADGNSTTAQFYFPVGVAVDGSGNIYVTDSSNHTIRKIY